MRRFLAIAGATVIAASLPIAALAQTSSPDLSALLAQLNALEQQIQSLSGTTTASTSVASNNVTAPASATPKGLCPDLSRSLSLGSEGADVSGLQSFLAEEGIFKGIATGYFGNLTAAAVASWQIQNNVVSGGDANTTGLGVVGPRTRVAMESSCLPNQTNTKAQCIPVFPPTTECPTNWQPVADQNGCTEYYKCTVDLPKPVASTSTSSALPATTTCPAVQKPTCSGTVTPFQVTSNGCVVSYQCTF